MEEFQQPVPGIDLDHRAAGLVGKSGIGAPHDGAEFVIGERVADIGPHHGVGDILVSLPGKARDGLGIKNRPILGHIETAIKGQAGQHGRLEREDRRVAAGRDVAHVRVTSSVGSGADT